MTLDAKVRADLAEAALKLAGAIASGDASGPDRPASWRDASLFDLAAAAGRPVGEFYGADLSEAVDCVEERFDRAIADGMSALDRSQSLRDRLFDLIMNRFEAMEPHRAALAELDPGADPVALALQHARRMRTARWVMALAGMDGAGVAGKARVQGLSVILAQTHTAWRQDKNGDFARTMAELDKALRRAEDMFGRFAGFTDGQRPGAAGAGSPEAPQAGSSTA